MWVSLVENNEHQSEGADYFIKKHIDGLLQKDASIDSILLACTHYPLLIEKIKKYVPEGIAVISQGKIVADSLKDYLHRHPEIEQKCSRNGDRKFFTTGDTIDFDNHATLFFGQQVYAEKLRLP